MIKICKHCKLPFEPEFYAHTREYCYEPKCIKKEKERLKEQSRQRTQSYTLEYKEKLKKRPLCTCCGMNPIMDGNRYLCYNCYTGNGDIVDMYSGWGADCESTTRRRKD